MDFRLCSDIVSTSLKLWKRATLPELQMHVAINSDGGNESHIEDGVCDPRDTQEKQCGAAKEEDIEVNAEGGPGEQYAEWG